MKFKYLQKVTIIGEPFFAGVVGKIVFADLDGSSFDVQLPGGQRICRYAYQLRAVTKRKSRGTSK